jgi:hypothetical protein
MTRKRFLQHQGRFPLRCDDPVLVQYDRLARINDKVMAALDADAPEPVLMKLMSEHQAVMADLAETEASNAPDPETIPARLAGARKMKTRVAAVQKKLEQKSRDLARQRETSNRTRQALDAYSQKK